jgi:hypothetical protein
MRQRITPDKKIKSIHVRCCEEEFYQIKEKALEKRQTLAVFIIEALRHYISTRT